MWIPKISLYLVSIITLTNPSPWLDANERPLAAKLNLPTLTSYC